ncbi:MAG TPA: DUF3606 domain-containing protein [Segetibacter sp.]|nr:DUF3606 domain-containing protein [Segetibacter sp.]
MGVEYDVTKPKDLTKINVNDFGELLWWSYILGVSIEKILITVDEIGPSAEQVKKIVVNR